MGFDQTDIMYDLKNNFYYPALAYVSDVLGLTEKEAESYVHVDVDEFSNTMGDGFQIEVGAELDYDDLMGLCEKLNPILTPWDENSYFEPIDPGIIEAYIWY